MRKGDLIELTVESVDEDALGEAFVDGVQLKISAAAPGDRVTVRIAHRSPHRKTAWCDLVEVHARGSHFIDPLCAHASAARGACTGCPAMHLDDLTIREMKTARISKALAAFLPTPAITYHPSPRTLEYRNRGHFVAGRDAKGEAFLGAYAKRSHTIIPLDDCPVLRPAARSLVRRAREWLSEPSLSIFPEPGGLRYVTLRASLQGEVLVDLVTTEERPERLIPLATRLMSIPPTVGVSYSINRGTGNALRTAPSTSIVGKETILEEMGGTTLALTAASFSQLNAAVAGNMYAHAASMCPKVGTVWDLYCGAGGLGLTVLRSQSERTVLYGADFAPTTTLLAGMNATPDTERAFFTTCDLSAKLPGFPVPPELVLLNPPRKGLDVPVHRFLEEASSVHTVIYMSCNPSSFAADIARLRTVGFSPAEVHAYDMLPFTPHVELIAKLRRAHSR